VAYLSFGLQFFIQQALSVHLTMKKIKFQATVSGPGYGYVYVMSYPGDDKLKIGHSLDPFTRAQDIGGTKAPSEPIVEAFFWCSERHEDVERASHRLERDNRHNGEWFAISMDRALETIQKAALDVAVEVKLVFDRNGAAKAMAEKSDEERHLAALLPKCMNCRSPLPEMPTGNSKWIHCKKCGYEQIKR
jgi:T5orf172 domain